MNPPRTHLQARRLARRSPPSRLGTAPARLDTTQDCRCARRHAGRSQPMALPRQAGRSPTGCKPANRPVRPGRFPGSSGRNCRICWSAGPQVSAFRAMCGRASVSAVLLSGSSAWATIPAISPACCIAASGADKRLSCGRPSATRPPSSNGPTSACRN